VVLEIGCAKSDLPARYCSLDNRPTSSLYSWRRIGGGGTPWLRGYMQQGLGKGRNV
jgi:hypothetical protein